VQHQINAPATVDLPASIHGFSPIIMCTKSDTESHVQTGYTTYGILIADDRWPLQIVQDIFAFGEDISLRILDLKALRRLWTEIAEASPSLAGYFRRRKNFDVIIAGMVEHYAYTEVDQSTGELPSCDQKARKQTTRKANFPLDWSSWQPIVPRVERSLWITQPSNLSWTRSKKNRPEWCEP
jgi:hypothetical protein